MGKVRVAVLGAASFAEVAHIPGVNAHPQGEVIALYSRDLARAREMAERAGIPEATDDLDALLARPDIDAVTTPSANDRHHPYAMAALGAGKHVFCEKPMALDAAQAAEMTHEARRSGLVNQIAFTFRYTYCLEETRRRVVAGEIGTPHFVEIHSEAFSPFVVKPGPATWRDFASLHGTGHLGEMGSHFVDAVNFVCGPLAGFVAEVAAVTHTLPRTVKAEGGAAQPVETIDIASFLFRTERGLQGHVLASRATPAPISYGMIHTRERQPGHLGYMVVTGDRGALLATFSRGEVESLRVMRPGERWEPVELPAEASDGQPHAVYRMLGGFIESILRGRVEPERDATFEDGFRSQAALDAIIAAGRSKRWEPVATDLPDVGK